MNGVLSLSDSSSVTTSVTAFGPVLDLAATTTGDGVMFLDGQLGVLVLGLALLSAFSRLRVQACVCVCERS